MVPSKKPARSTPRESPRHLEVLLAPGWRFDRRRFALLGEGGCEVRLRGLLPPGAKVFPLAPTLIRRAARTLSDDEALLVRYLQVVLVPPFDLGIVAAGLRDLDGVQSVTSPPPPSPPRAGA